MTWQTLTIAPASTHHLRLGLAAYPERFDEVLKFHPPGLAPVRSAARAWHIHPDGQAAYPQRFRRTFGYYEGLAAVVGEEGWFHITPSGEAAYPQRYAWCGNFQEGRCSVRQHDGRYLHIRSDGEPVYGERWRYAGDFRDGIGVVQAENGRSSHIEADGRLLHSQWFLDLDVFHKGFARARDEDGWMHVDGQGYPLYARRFAAVEPFYNGQARVERFDGGLMVVDETGDAIVELRPAMCSEFAALSGDMVGFWRTQTIAAAVELGVIEALPGTEAAVAEACQLHPGRARRLLRALGELSLVVQDGGSWQCTPRGAYLRQGHPLTLADAAREYARHFSKMWEGLPEALRASGGWHAPDIFGEVARDASRQESHHRMLLSYARHDYPGVPAALGLRGNERLVDAGGGLGFLAMTLLDTYPNLRVILLDRPEVIEQARQLQPALPGIDWRAGDIFQPWQVGADAVVLARILHDWDDAAATRILRHAREALSPGGRLYIIEMVVPEAGVAGCLCDLHLLMATGGQERTLSEYARLLAGAGFELDEVRPLAALPSILVGVAR
jgi:hypothetical protein